MYPVPQARIYISTWHGIGIYISTWNSLEIFQVAASGYVNKKRAFSKKQLYNKLEQPLYKNFIKKHYIEPCI